MGGADVARDVGVAARVLDDVDTIRAHIPALMRASGMGPPGFNDFLVGWCCWRVGDLDEAKRRFSHYPKMPSRDPALAAFVADCLVDVDAVRLAAECLSDIHMRKRRLFSLGLAAYVVELPFDHYAAHLLRALGRFDEARALHESALAFAREIGAHGQIARLEAALASCPHAATATTNATTSAATNAATNAATDAATNAATNAATSAATAATTATTMKVGIGLVRDGDTWRIDGGAAPLRLKDSRGLQMLSVLIARAGEDVHAIDLMNAREVDGAMSSVGDVVDGGDAGDLLDDTAKLRYRARLREIDAALDDESSPLVAARRERMLAEKEALVRELARGLGLGGRARKAGSAAERARVAVQRRLRDAIEKVRTHDAALAAHLDRCVRTGALCCYRP
jgi:hypothetical protein